MFPAKETSTLSGSMRAQIIDAQPRSLSEQMFQGTDLKSSIEHSPRQVGSGLQFSAGPHVEGWPGAQSTGVVSLEMPFPAADKITAARQAGRADAQKIDEAKHQALLSERQALITLKLDNAITPQQLKRLKYVRWALYRIDDARHGHLLDQLENQVSEYENTVKRLQSLELELSRFGTKRR